MVMNKRLNKMLLYTYGVPDLCFSLMINMEVYFFTIFLTDYALFSLALVTQILVVTSIIDIVCSLAGGVFLQKVNLKFGGKYRSWFLIGPPIVAPLFILQFTKIGGDWTAAAIIMFGFVTSHLLFNVVFAASGSLMGKLSPLPEERTILSASRAQGMSAAGLVFAATAVPMIEFFDARISETTGYAFTVGVYAAMMILGYLFIFRMTTGKDPYEETEKGPAGQKSGESTAGMILLVLKNPPLLCLVIVMIFVSTSFFIITGMAMYYFTYVVGKPALLSLFILAISIARLVGNFAATWIGVTLGKRKSYWIFILLAAVGFASGWLFMDSPWEFILMFCLATVFISVAGSMNTALFADTVVYGEWKTGRNIRAFTMALMNLPIKLGVLIKSSIISAGLIVIGFEANTEPTLRVVEGIVTIMTLVPAAAYVIAAVIFYVGYRIEEKDVLRMQEDIAARRC
jgi:GPH family glycoside/pentoside/hexuronide:cation symporter